MISKQNIWRDAFYDTIPVMTGYVPLAIVFGYMAVQAGLSSEVTVASSLLIYAGASQFMMVPMVAVGLPISVIVFATFVVNLRHVFYGIALLDRYPKNPFKYWYCVYSLTDETFSLVTTLPKDTPTERLFAISLFNHFWWVAGTVLGVLFGARFQVNLVGLDYVLCCLFAMLATEQWRNRKTSWSLTGAVASYALARFLSVQNALLIAVAFCVVICLLWSRFANNGEAR